MKNHGWSCCTRLLISRRLYLPINKLTSTLKASSMASISTCSSRETFFSKIQSSSKLVLIFSKRSIKLALPRNKFNLLKLLEELVGFLWSARLSGNSLSRLKLALISTETSPWPSVQLYEQLISASLSESSSFISTTAIPSPWELWSLMWKTELLARICCMTEIASTGWRNRLQLESAKMMSRRRFTMAKTWSMST